VKPSRQIIVMDRGIVLVGVVYPVEGEPLLLRLTDCGVIRRWGTTKGLGELALKGPQSGTIIDKEPDGTLINRVYVMRLIPCSSGWK